MTHIKLHKREQLYFLANNRAIPAISIDLDRDNHRVIIHKYSSDKEYDTHLIGCINLDTEIEAPIEEYDFIDEF
jgi:hypothetical protein